MTLPLAVWRSVLFVPAQVQRFIDAAPRSGADAIQLDLEDSVPTGQKAVARTGLPAAVEALTMAGAEVLVRINRDLRNAVADLEAAAIPGVRAISVPKVSGPEHLQLVDELLSELEAERSLPRGSIGLIAMIESLSGLACAPALALACPRVIGLTIGSEDFSADAGMEPTRANLFHPCQQILFAARAAGVQAYGFPGSIAGYGDLALYGEQVTQGRSMGFDGAFCIHPSQVAVLNEMFTPSPDALAEARDIVAAYESALAGGRAAAAFDGRMIDLPVVARARALIARAR
ncbi:MAG: CoA ester lyase [Halieaceae bacterium]|jgi:citrate lyase subunit beta/citryl-CoA lyase|nr:CoA ester lyase [Halieaceae bacterium]